MPLDVRLVANDAELDAVYRLRYVVYIEEMGRLQKFRDDVKKMIVEPLDDGAHILAAFSGPEVVGTVRHNYGRDGNLGYYADLYRMKSAGSSHPDQTCATTKLLVHPRHRGNAGFALAVAAYRKAASDGIRFGFLDCNDPLVPFFEKLGYRDRGKIIHPEYGEVNLMVLDLHDLEHLLKVDSPFISHCEELVPRSSRSN